MQLTSAEHEISELRPMIPLLQKEASEAKAQGRLQCCCCCEINTEAWVYMGATPYYDTVTHFPVMLAPLTNCCVAYFDSWCAKQC
jgi:hypothetical protein